MKSPEMEEYKEKQKAFENIMLNAWLTTKLEHDKQLLSLSVTAIGLLVTLLRITGVRHFLELFIFTLTLGAFLITVISVLAILRKNADYIEMALQESGAEKTSCDLDKIACCSFTTGIILVAIIGIMSAAENINGNLLDMSQDKPPNTSQQSATNNDSWKGVSKFRPQQPKSQNTPPQSSATTPNAPSGSDESGSGNTSPSDSGNAK